MLAGAAIGLIVFLLLRLAGQLMRLVLLLAVLVARVLLLLVVDLPYAKTRHAVLFGLVLIGSLLWHLYGARST